MKYTTTVIVLALISTAIMTYIGSEIISCISEIAEPITDALQSAGRK